jgi:hypothetical protein
MRKIVIASCAAAVLAFAGGIVAGRAVAEDEMPAGGMPQEKPIDGHALVKALTANKWTTKSTSSMGGGEGETSYRLGAGKTALVQDYDSKSAMGAYSGLGITKVSADGKTATMWWFNSMSPNADEYTGPITENGYELTGTVDNMQGGKAKANLKLTKKGEGFEFTYTMDGQLMFTDVYTKAK